MKKPSKFIELIVVCWILQKWRNHICIGISFIHNGRECPNFGSYRKYCSCQQQKVEFQNLLALF